MHKIILLTLLLSASCLAFTHGHHHWHGHGRHGHGHGHGGDWHGQGGFHGWQDNHEEKFERLAGHLINADNYAEHFCNGHRIGEVQEMYGTQGYTLKYAAPSSHVNDITMKIKHRAVYMQAVQKEVNSPQTFVDVRILPKMLNTSQAKWTYDGNYITLTIPYNMSLDQLTNTQCTGVNENVITVPNVPTFVYKSGFGDQQEDTYVQ